MAVVFCNLPSARRTKLEETVNNLNVVAEVFAVLPSEGFQPFFNRSGGCKAPLRRELNKFSL